MKEIRLNVNGTEYDIAVRPHATLLEVLREDLGLIGTKEGCGEGECGACTVIIEGKAANSCIVLALEADGKEVTTIEGLADGGKLHPIQEAFVEIGGLQCGFCTPGMMMTATALLSKNPNPTEAEVRDAIRGNLCRCTGYVNIVKAIQLAGKKMQAGGATEGRTS